MDYPKNGFETEDDYIDYIDDLRRKWKSSVKEADPKFWINEDPEMSKMISDNLLNITIELENVEKEKDDLTSILDRTQNETQTGLGVFWKELMIDLIFKRKIENLKKLISYCRLALYEPREDDPNIITPEQIALAKTIPIENFIGQSPRMSGNKMFFCCPFHEEKTGSFAVFLKDNTYHCFGCGKSGDSISFIREFENLDFADSVRFLIGQHK